MSVKSVYNFVPAPKEDEVFKPDWADQVSHDIPFSDGESGEIEIRITAETPIFIRNGHSNEDKIIFERFQKNPEFNPNEEEQNCIDRYLSFSNHNGKYFIPASSLKGMFRNVLEIFTASRMIQTESISDKHPITYGLRDMNNPQYTKDNAKVKSGWLIKQNDNWVIKSCTYHRISLKDIEGKFDLPEDSLKDSGIKKNETCESKIKNELFTFSEVDNLGKWVGMQYSFNDQGDFEAYVVLYGDIDNKKYDYIFSQPNGSTYSVPSRLIEIFDNIEENRENKDDSLWRYFRRKNWQPGIPVFFTVNIDNKSVKHFGLTKLYRRNNSHYLHELEPFKSYLSSEDNEKLDLAELLFGSVRTEALKGRIYISNAWSKNASIGNQEERILNSPKPSFYPAYLKQNGNNGNLEGPYKTYHDSDAELRGFKRYPVHSNIKLNIESDNEKIASQFIPLMKGTIFTGKIRYFNLRPFELGALVSAITFHGNSGHFYHSIGSAKPYGFGKLRVEISNLKDVQPFMKHFEWTINDHLKKLDSDKFINQGAIIELVSMASNPENPLVNELLKYPLLEVVKDGKKHNEFNDYKKDKKFLESYSERNGEFKISSLIDEEFINIKNQQIIQAKQEKEKKIQVQRDKERKAFDAAVSTNDIAELNIFLQDFPNSFLKKEVEQKIEEINQYAILAEEERKKTEEVERIRKKQKEEMIEADKMGKEDFQFPNNEFKSTKELLNGMLNSNKHFNFSESQINKIEQQVRNCWREDRDSFYKKRKLIKFPKYPWSDIKKWLGPDKTKALYEELTKN